MYPQPDESTQDIDRAVIAIIYAHETTHIPSDITIRHIKRSQGDFIRIFIKKEKNTSTFIKDIHNGVLISPPNCTLAAEIGLRFRDYFLGINWTRIHSTESFSIKICITFGSMIFHLDRDNNPEDISGNIIHQAICIANKTVPWSASCTEAFTSTLHTETNNNFKTAYLTDHSSTKVYSLHWKNELTEVNARPTTEDCEEYITTLRKTIAHDVIKTAHCEVSNTFKTAMCYNQGKLVQYIHTASELIKQIETITKKTTNAPSRIKIKKLIDSLHKHFYNEYVSIAKENFKLFKELREKNKSAQQVRVHTKSQVSGRDKDSALILTYGRDEDETYDEYYPSFRVEDHSGISNIIDTGEYYICNDIITASHDQNFKHPRLDTSTILSLTLDDIEHNDWGSFWKRPLDKHGKPVQIRNSACFKSTLIIPMTLYRNSLPHSFWESISTASGLTAERHPCTSNLSRTIFGYLCVDSTQKNAFDSTFDVDIGYFFADILSFYHFVHQSISLMSRVYKNALDFSLEGHKKINSHRAFPNKRTHPIKLKNAKSRLSKCLPQD